MCLSTEGQSQWGRGESNSLPGRQSYCLKRTKQTPGLGVAITRNVYRSPTCSRFKPQKILAFWPCVGRVLCKIGEGSLGSNLFPLLLKARWPLSSLWGGLYPRTPSGQT